MDLLTIFNAELILLCLAVAAIMYPVKRAGDIWFKRKPLWSHVALPVLSLAVGAGLGVAFKNVLGGLVASLLAQLVYGKVKSLLAPKDKASGG